jgi:hypothetical protein
MHDSVSMIYYIYIYYIYIYYIVESETLKNTQ